MRMNLDVPCFLERLKLWGNISSPCKFDRTEFNDGVDWISQLPDEVIAHIMTFLPLNRARATSRLSQRWKELWKDLPILNFDDWFLQEDLYHLIEPLDSITQDNYRSSKFQMQMYVGWVNSVLRLHKARSLQCFTIVVLVDKSEQHQVTSWLDFAFSRRVKMLKLISQESWVNAGVLAEMLKAMSVPSSNFKSLRVLRLKGFRMSSEAIEFLLRNCAMLERLVLKMLCLSSDLEVGGSLKCLDMRMPFSGSSVKVCAPNLTGLTVDHDSKKVVLENVPNLVNMTFYCRTTDTMHDFANVAAQLEALTIVLIHPGASFSVPEMPKLKKLVVYYSLQEEKVLFPVTRLLWACPVLEEFKMEIGEVAAERDIFRIPEDGPPLQHERLRRFVLAGLCRDRIEVVRYMVNHCVALDEIVVGGEGLVRELGDYCVPLKDQIWQPMYTKKEYVATAPQERRDIKKAVRLFTPPRIRLQVV